MSKQIENYYIKKSKKQVGIAVMHLIKAAEAIQEIDPEWLPLKLVHFPDYMMNIVNGLMDIWEYYADELLNPD